MNGFIGLGKWLFAVPFFVFGILHFMGADQMAGMAPGGKMMVYLTGVLHIAASVSIMMGKFDKLATVLLAVMVLLFIIPHYQMMSGGDESQMSNILKNIMIAGGALLYAGGHAKDNSVIG